MIKLFDLKVGNIVHIIDRKDKVISEDVVLTFENFLDFNRDNITISGIPIIDLNTLVSKLGFYIRNSIDLKGRQTVDAALSVDKEDSCYFIFARMENGQCIISIEHYKEVVCTAKVKYIHQVRNIISTIIE